MENKSITREELVEFFKENSGKIVDGIELKETIKRAMLENTTSAGYFFRKVTDRIFRGTKFSRAKSKVFKESGENIIGAYIDPSSQLNYMGADFLEALMTHYESDDKPKFMFAAYKAAFEECADKAGMLEKDLITPVKKNDMFFPVTRKELIRHLNEVGEKIVDVAEFDGICEDLKRDNFSLSQKLYDGTIGIFRDAFISSSIESELKGTTQETQGEYSFTSNSSYHFVDRQHFLNSLCCWKARDMPERDFGLMRLAFNKCADKTPLFEIGEIKAISPSYY